MHDKENEENWSLVIKPQSKLLNFHFKDLWTYRDLVIMFVRRDFFALYKQTILGPLWFFVQPILTTIMFTVVFGNIAKIGTDGVPRVLFYLAGLTIWNYFAECVTATSETFVKNSNIFGKVYFPRLVMPVSVVISNLMKFGVQLFLFLAVYVYFLFTSDSVHPNSAIFLFPLLVINMGMLGLGTGMIISALTTKYRDLRFLVSFGVQLLMYGSAIIYPLSEVPEQYRWIVELNPIVPIVEAFKYGFLGKGTISMVSVAQSFSISIIIFLLGVLIFNRVEKTFMDTV